MPHNVIAPSIFVIVVNYVTYKRTIEFIEHVKLQEKIELKIIVVENGSPNESWDKLLKTYREDNSVILIKNEANKGYAGGINSGLNYILQLKPDFIVISNNDVLLTRSDLIYSLFEEYSKLKSPGLIAPQMLNAQNKPVKHQAWKIPSIFDDIRDSSRLVKLLLKPNYSYNFDLSDRSNMAVECLPGSFFLANPEFFRKTGFLDENTFLYCEERILGYKAKQAGFNNYLIRSLSFIHNHATTTLNTIGTRNMFKYLYNSREYFHKKYSKAPTIHSIILKLFNRIGLLETFIVCSLKKLKNQ